MSVQIDQDLWADLVRYHVMDLRDPDVDARIRAGLQRKIDAMVRRQAYTASKTACTPEARERARQRYLDMVGVPEDYRRAPDNTTNNT